MIVFLSLICKLITVFIMFSSWGISCKFSEVLIFFLLSAIVLLEFYHFNDAIFKNKKNSCSELQTKYSPKRFLSIIARGKNKYSTTGRYRLCRYLLEQYILKLKRKYALWTRQEMRNFFPSRTRLDYPPWGQVETERHLCSASYVIVFIPKQIA